MTKKVCHKLVYPKVEFLFCLERSICISFRKEKRTLLCPAKIELKKFKWLLGLYYFMTGNLVIHALAKHIRDAEFVILVRFVGGTGTWKKPQHEN